MLKLLIPFCLCVYSLPAQVNLVSNGSFEVYTKYPNWYSAVSQAGAPQEYLPTWVSPTFGTPDFMHACDPIPNSVGVPRNVFGYQPAKDGSGYGGLFVLATNDTTSDQGIVREYLCTRLKSPMKAGNRYCISFYASPGNVIDVNYKSYLFGTNTLALWWPLYGGSNIRRLPFVRYLAGHDTIAPDN